MPIRSQRPARRHAPASVLAGIVMLALVACHQSPPATAPKAAPEATPKAASKAAAQAPAKTVAKTLHLIAIGDFDGLMKNRLPSTDYAAWRREWVQAHHHPASVSAAQRKQFAQVMQQLTQPGAEAKLMQRLKPELAGVKRRHAVALPVFASIVSASLGKMLSASPQLGPAQRTLAKQGLAALAAWAGTADLGDLNKAKQAIALVCAAARQLHVQTLKQWHALDYAAAMHAYGIVWNAIESVLRIYGLDLGKSLINAKVTTVSRAGPRAVVKLDMVLAGKPLTGQWAMREQAGDWYNVALLDAWQNAHRTAPAAAGSSPSPAPAGTTSSPPAPAVSAAPHGT